MNKLFLLYLKDVNTLDEESNHKKFILSRHRGFEKFLIKVMGATIGLYTLKVAVEQMIMQLRL